jgi:hypothetical protein
VLAAAVRCSARACSRTIHAVGSFSDGTARCRMTVPKGTKGKMLRGTISVETEDGKTTKAFAFKIK